ncbi:MAG: hypothetical protein ACRDRT_16950 [Pseudonocardiaceae bacterium]
MATLVARLDLEALISATVRLVGRVGGSSPGAKVLTLVNAMIAGRPHRPHRRVALWWHRCGGGPPGVRPLTVGTFLRAFTFGHVRQLEAVCGKVLERA